MSSSKCSFTCICGIFLPLNPSTTTVYARSAFYPSLRFTLSLQSAFYTQSAFYPWSAVCSPQSSFYTDRKSYIDDVLSLWESNRKDVELFIKEANNSVHPTIKFTAEISENEITFLDTIVCKGERFTEKSISKPTISRLKPFNVPTSPRATLQG